MAWASAHELAVPGDQLAVGGDAPAVAQVADEIPVDRAGVLAAGFRVRAADRHVDGAADLLVEEDRADRAVDAEVRADAELAEPAGAVVGGQRGLQVLVALVGARRDDFATAELELDAAHETAGRPTRDVEADAALGARLDRPGEDLP